MGFLFFGVMGIRCNGIRCNGSKSLPFQVKGCGGKFKKLISAPSSIRHPRVPCQNYYESNAVVETPSSNLFGLPTTGEIFLKKSTSRGKTAGKIPNAGFSNTGFSRFYAKVDLNFRQFTKRPKILNPIILHRFLPKICKNHLHFCWNISTPEVGISWNNSSPLGIGGSLRPPSWIMGKI